MKAVKQVALITTMCLELVACIWLLVSMAYMCRTNNLKVENLRLQNEREKAEIEHTELLSNVIMEEELMLHEATRR